MELNVKFFNDLTTAELYEIVKARAEVFVVEQNIVYQDMDDIDYDSLHCFYLENGKITAYLRAFHPNGDPDTVKIGRVLTTKRGEGLGKRLMEESLVAIKENMRFKRLTMDAQKYAIGFYEKFGFKVTSPEFWEEGILHVKMEL